MSCFRYVCHPEMSPVSRIHLSSATHLALHRQHSRPKSLQERRCSWPKSHPLAKPSWPPPSPRPALRESQDGAKIPQRWSPCPIAPSHPTPLASPGSQISIPHPRQEQQPMTQMQPSTFPCYCPHQWSAEPWDFDPSLLLPRPWQWIEVCCRCLCRGPESWPWEWMHCVALWVPNGCRSWGTLQLRILGVGRPPWHHKRMEKAWWSMQETPLRAGFRQYRRCVQMMWRCDDEMMGREEQQGIQWHRLFSWYCGHSHTNLPQLSSD